MEASTDWVGREQDRYTCSGAAERRNVSGGESALAFRGVLQGKENITGPVAYVVEAPVT